MERITSRENERVKCTLRLASSAALRREQGLFFAEGLRLCLDLAACLPWQTAFFTEEVLAEEPRVADLSAEAFLVNDSVAQKLSATKTTQGLFGVFRLPQAVLEDLDVSKGVLLAEHIQDPANVGAMLRSAAAFGFGGVVLAGNCADPFGPKVLRASMGAVGRLPVVVQDDIQQAAGALHKAGATLYASALQGAAPLAQVAVQRPFVLLVGNEGAGLSAEVLALADERVCIPMHAGVDSLNAAVAASVLMFHFSGSV